MRRFHFPGNPGRAGGNTAFRAYNSGIYTTSETTNPTEAADTSIYALGANASGTAQTRSCTTAAAIRAAGTTGAAGDAEAFGDDDTFCAQTGDACCAEAAAKTACSGVHAARPTSTGTAPGTDGANRRITNIADTSGTQANCGKTYQSTGF